MSVDPLPGRDVAGYHRKAETPLGEVVSSTILNFAVALFSIGVSFVLTITTTTITSDRPYNGYLIVTINCFLIGTILFVYWLKTRTSVGMTVMKIKSRLVITPPIQEPMTPDA